MSEILENTTTTRRRAERENFIVNDFIENSWIYTAQEVAMQLSWASNDQLSKIHERVTKCYRKDLIEYKYLIIDIVRSFLEDLSNTNPEIIWEISRLYNNGHRFTWANGWEISDEMLWTKVISDLQELFKSDQKKAESIARWLLQYWRDLGITS